MKNGRKNILLVEDEKTIAELFTRVMRRKGWEVTNADNGESACRAFPEKTWDCIVMDLHMPRMNGMTATQQIRKYERDHGIASPVPILAFTAHTDAHVEAECRRIGMTGLLKKPIHVRQFITEVEGYMASGAVPELRRAAY